jgi:hypothetical protein
MENRKKHSTSRKSREESAQGFKDVLAKGIGSSRREPAGENGIAAPQDARDDLHDRVARLLIDRENRAKQNQDFQRALRAITTRVTEPERNRAIDNAELLASLACRAVSGKKRGGQRALKILWPQGTGKTWKALSEFPDRLRRIAEEVERVNASPFFAPAAFANAKIRRVEIARKFFTILPGVMRVYAGGLEAHIKRLPGLFEKQFPSAGPNQWLLLLSCTVRIVTGKYHDRQVADLLNAAAVALSEERQFEALAIAQARVQARRKKDET